MEPVNPYQTPPLASINTAPDKEIGAFIPGGRMVPAGHGVEWLASGWQLFAKAPGMWVINFILMMVISFILGIVVPFSGAFLSVFFSAGFVLGAHALSRGEPLEVKHLFAGLQTQAGSLLLVALISLGFSLVLMTFLVGGLLLLLGGTGFMALLAAPDYASAINWQGVILGLLLLLLIWLALLLPLVMAMWFAPALVVLHNRKPWEAMKMSFTACLKNVVPFLLYSIVMLVLCIIALIPLGLGYLILIPMSFASLYTSCQDIFTESP